ncbi:MULTISPECIES: creatininase family protein [Nocardiaceae]|uniref:creatininase family protein n=1 Tax=Nocardiaceae TaxID=85025 RepID=UPI0008380F4A|nr:MULTISPECIES: creatininase family protein [Rhodococcus]NIL74160.1 putative mycofactocin system creatinine amidohydrolase family protein MftE [Rhodococcus sp. B10]
MTELRIENLTTEEVREAISGGIRTAILPLGATEQHGSHLPLSMDADHADALAVRIAHELGNALVLPTIRVGYSPHHLGFPGTLTIRASTLEALCEDYGAHLTDSGFERLIVFSGHIGNYPVMREFSGRLAAKLAPLSLVVFDDGEAIIDAWRRTADEIASLGASVGGHADVAETSVMLALHPEKVRAKRYARGFTGTVDTEFLERTFRDGIESMSPSGILGDPHGASNAIGVACLHAVTSLIVQYARHHGA